MIGKPMTERRKATLVAAIVLVLLVLGVKKLRAAPLEAVVPVATVEAGALLIEVAETVPAGDAFAVSVEGATGSEPVMLLVDSAYGLRRVTAEPVDGTAVFEVPPANGPESRTVNLTATQGTLVGASSTRIVPGEAVDPHDLYLGPRTVLADGVDFTMIVSVPEDRFGNPVATGTPVIYTTTRPNLAVDVGERATEHLLSYERVTSRTATGRTRIAVTVGSATGREMTFLEVAGFPAPFTLENVDPLLPADGITLIRIRTSELADRFSNVLPDGTDVILDLKGATGLRRLRGETIRGVAEFQIEAPDVPGSVVMVATASGTQSSPLQVSFSLAVSEIPLLARPDLDGIRVDIGPVITSRGSYVAEGTIAAVRTTLADGTEEVHFVPLGGGLGFVVIDERASEVEVEVLGFTESVTELPS